MYVLCVCCVCWSHENTKMMHSVTKMYHCTSLDKPVVSIVSIQDDLFRFKKAVFRAVCDSPVFFDERCVAIENVKVGTLLRFSSRGWSKKFERKAVPRRPPGNEVLAPTGTPKEHQSCPGAPAVSVSKRKRRR